MKHELSKNQIYNLHSIGQILKSMLENPDGYISPWHAIDMLAYYSPINQLEYE